MSDVIEVKAVDPAAMENLKTWGWVSYILHLIVSSAKVRAGIPDQRHGGDQDHQQQQNQILMFFHALCSSPFHQM